jgi:hypothetical protein
VLHGAALQVYLGMIALLSAIDRHCTTHVASITLVIRTARRMNARVQALASVMQRGTLETMHAVARDITLLDHAPLQLQHDISNLAVSLKLSYAAASAMVQLQPLVIRVEPEAVASRASTLAQLLQLQPLTAQLLQLLQQHPELLLPPSSLTAANHQNLLLLESVTPSILSSWLHQAPLLVITPADVVAHRLAEVRQLLGDSTDQLQVISYIALDARVLLCSKAVLQERLRVLPQLMGLARDQADKLAKQHPVYLAMDPGGTPGLCTCLVRSMSACSWVCSRILLRGCICAQQPFHILQGSLLCVTSVLWAASTQVVQVLFLPRAAVLHQLGHACAQQQDQLGAALQQSPSLQRAYVDRCCCCVRAGAVDLWLRDIQQLTLADEQQARGLAQEPAVLRSGPEQVLQALERVAAAQGCSVVQALDHCAQQHALLTGALSC